MIEVRKARRKGETVWLFSIEVAKKKFNCEHAYKSEKSCETAAKNFVKRYIKEA